MKLIAFNNQLAILPSEDEETQTGSGQGEETETEETEETNETNEETEGSDGGEDKDEETEGSESNGDSDDKDAEDTEGDEGAEGSDSGDSEETEGSDSEGSGEEEGDDTDTSGESSDSSDDETSNMEGSDSDDLGEDFDGPAEQETIDLRELSQDFEQMDGAQDAGGNQFLDKDDKAQQEALAEMLENLLDQMDGAGEEDIDLKGHNESFTEHFENQQGDLLENEAYWRPYDPGQDVVRLARNGDKDVARRYQSAVKREVGAITTKLRSKFLMARQPTIQHGVRKGKGLSERRLVDSVVELRSGRRATRPDWNKVDKQACTLAVGVVIDQSGSMQGENQVYAAQGAMAIAEPLDKLGAPVMVCGPRTGSYGYQCETWEERNYVDTNAGSYSTGKYHRAGSVTIDLFKNWDESFVRCRDRFANVSANGGTPLSDGIQYAMQELSDRTEVHRVIIVLTDGAANCPLVVNRQIRLAKEAGITVIGVGIGDCCSTVVKQFPANHIQIPNVKELPKKLMAMLEDIMFPKRAKKARMDGRIG